jgi:hypothetical protein
VVHEVVQEATHCRSSLIIIRKNVGLKVEHLKFRIDLIECELVKYSVQHKVPGQMVRTTLRRSLQNGILLEESLQKKNKCMPTRWFVVCSKHDKKGRLFSVVSSVMFPCASVSVLRPTT